MAETSTKPYMIRALYEWCCDNGYTPYLAVSVDQQTRVPRQHVKGGEIVLNVSPTATNRLELGNEFIEFQARFSGVAQEISIPIGNVSAIYARETGHGMAFEVERVVPADGEASEDADAASGAAAGSSAGRGRGETADARDAADAMAGGDTNDDSAADDVPDNGAPVAPDGAGARRRSAAVTRLPGREQAGGAEVIAFAPAPGGRSRKAGATARSPRKPVRDATDESLVPSAGVSRIGGGRSASARMASDESAGSGASGDESAGSDASGNEATGHQGTGNEAAGSSGTPLRRESTDPARLGDNSGKGSTGDDASGDDAPGNDEPPTGGGKSGRARLTRVK